MKYLMQVLIVDPTTKAASWVSVKGSHLATPYEYDTRKEAEHMLYICYGGQVEKERLRVIEKP